MSLKAGLQQWDGKSTDDLCSLYLQYKDSASFVKQLISLLVEGESAIGASWLIKHYLDERQQLSKAQTRTVINTLANCEHWQTRLHLLQCLPYLTIEETQRKLVEAFARAGLQDVNKFVRAWSYNGLCLLAERFTELQDEAKSIVAMAMKDEAASVKARLRNIKTEMAWLRE